jgi:hypothetical protein
MNITRSLITGNSSPGNGAGINNNVSAVMRISNSTITNNSALNIGGGIINFNELEMNNVTVSDNTAAKAGGGVDNTQSGVTVKLRNTIVASNLVQGLIGRDANGAFNSLGNNLISDTAGSTGFGTAGDILNQAANLGALQNNGGATDTRALLPGSPAINAGNTCVINSSCSSHNPFAPLKTDQRGTGFARQIETAVDIGAVETQPAFIVSISGSVTYGNPPPAGQTTKPVPNVTLSSITGPSASGVTSSTGVYTINNLTSGVNYTIAPAKTGDVNGITAFDATLILRCVAAGANCTLTNNQRKAADTDNDNSVTSFDATQILRFVAANAATANTGQVGLWKFDPAIHNYPALNSNLSNENFTAFLIGEVDGDWTPPASLAENAETELQGQQSKL